MEQQSAAPQALTMVEELDAADHYREPTNGRFVAGHRVLPGAGRPRKGETIAEKLARADVKVARKAIRARDKRLELTNAVGERAWSTYLAYNLGLPAQKYVIEGAGGDAAIDALLARVAYVVEPQGVPLLPPPTDA